MDASQDPTPSAPEAHGRHRAASASRWGTRQTLLAAAGVLLLLVVGGAAAFVLLGNDGTTTAGPSPSAPAGTTASSAATTPATTSSPPVTGGLGLKRTVTVRGSVVTVVERYTATAASPVVLAPLTGSGDTTLRPLSLQLVAEDGTVSPFRAPVTVNADGSVTVRGQYRLRYCPDLVPLAWPTTSRVTTPGVPVDVVRSDEPLRTARAVCPGVPPQATAAPQLRVARFTGRAGEASVRLVWSGGPVRLAAVGAPSGFPLSAVPTAAERCGSDCLAPLRRGRPVTLTLRPVDGCPTRFQKSDGLPLLVERGGRTQVVSVSARGLGRWYVGACR